jgi:hypothetical protein
MGKNDLRKLRSADDIEDTISSELGVQFSDVRESLCQPATESTWHGRADPWDTSLLPDVRDWRSGTMVRAFQLWIEPAATHAGNQMLDRTFTERSIPLHPARYYYNPRERRYVAL